MNIKPLAGRVVVKPLTETATKSGIVIPDTVDKDRPERGQVVAVGDGKLLENGQRAPVDVKVGDIVILKKYGPMEVKIDGTDYLVAEMEDLIAIVL
jgi:chaperonin GroES